MRTSNNVRDVNSVLTLILFLLSNLAVIFPVRAPIPQIFVKLATRLLRAMRIVTPSATPVKRVSVRLNFITVPLVSVLVLLATSAFDGEIVRRGVIGADGIKPLDILALFISLAYISISLDFTGLLRFSALWVAQKGGSSGRKLYFYLYIFFLLCGVIVGNDPVILSGTAFLAYFTRVAGITPPTAWIFSQFAAANMASVVLVSSNPTNLVISGAFSIPFMTYTAHVILPFLVSALLVFPTLAIIFFRSELLVPKVLAFVPTGREAGNENGMAETQRAEDRNAILIDKQGAVFGSVVLVAALGVLVGTSTIGVPVWEVTVPAAGIVLMRDVYHDWKLGANGGQVNGDAFPLRTIQGCSEKGHVIATPAHADFPDTERHAVDLGNNVDAESSSPFDLLSFIQHCLNTLSSRFPTFTTILKRLPISLLPFAILMFILVQGLSAQGWVEVFARWWSAWVKKTGVLGAIGGMGFISCILCNICGTNIGATILLARVLQLWLSQSSSLTPTIDPKIRDGTIYALALGSNYGAFTWTFSASLAGLLWRRILLQKGIRVRGRQFLILNFPVAFVAMLASCGVLATQVHIVHRSRN